MYIYNCNNTQVQILLYVPTEAAVEIVIPLKDIAGLEKDTVTFTCQLSKPNRTDGRWLCQGVELKPDSTKYEISFDECNQTLTIKDLTLTDQGPYTYSIENVSTSATLFVDGKRMCPQCY